MCGAGGVGRGWCVDDCSYCGAHAGRGSWLLSFYCTTISRVWCVDDCRCFGPRAARGSGLLRFYGKTISRALPKITGYPGGHMPASYPPRPVCSSVLQNIGNEELLCSVPVLLQPHRCCLP